MTPSKEHLQQMLEYVHWADGEILTASRSVPDSGYFKEQGISLGSIHKLLVHLMAAQWIWVSRWRGEAPKRLESHEDYPTRDALMQRWPLVHSAVADFVGMQSPRSLSQDLQYRTTRGELFSLPLADQILHVIDHDTYHRGQLNTMIKQAGGQPGNISYQIYALQKRRML